MGLLRRQPIPGRIALDEVTAYRGALPQDSTNFKGDYGSSDFDSRNIFVGLVSYNVPGTEKWNLLSKGWQLNSLLTFHSGNAVLGV